MITREELYRRFGPMLIEAQTLVIKDEINIIRRELGLSERTNQQILHALENKLNSLMKYDWMNDAD